MKHNTETWGTPAEPKEQLVPITPDRLRRLIQLTHPDRHGGSAVATEVFKWLMEIKCRTGLDTPTAKV